MKQFLTKRIKVLGRSIPVAVIALAITAVVAMAGYLVIVRVINYQITTASFGPFSLVSTSTSAGTCTGAIVAGDLEVTWADPLPGDGCTIDLVHQNDGSNSAFGAFAEVAAVPEVAAADLTCGLEMVAAGGQATYRINVQINGNAQPGQSLQPIYSLGFFSDGAEALAACLP
jgi:hypothetical protein